MRHAEFVEKLGVGSALFERVELLAVQVLEQRVAQQHVVVGFADDRWDSVEAGLLRGPPAPFAHDQFVSLLRWPDDDRLEESDLAQRMRQFVERRFVEYLPRLLRVRPDVAQRNLGVSRTRYGHHALVAAVSRHRGIRDRAVGGVAQDSQVSPRRRRRNKRPEASAQPATSGVHA